MLPLRHVHIFIQKAVTSACVLGFAGSQHERISEQLKCGLVGGHGHVLLRNPHVL
jgi:hypothetical protein